MENKAEAVMPSTPASIATLPDDEAPLNIATFQFCIARLEAAKNQTFAPETIKVWFDEFRRIGWTNRKMRQRYLAVMHMPQVRTLVTFDDFLHAPPATSKEVVDDARKLANAMVERRKEWLRSHQWNEAELERAGMVAVSEMYHAEFLRRRDAYVEQLKKRFESTRRSISRLSDETLRRLYTNLVERGIVEPDKLSEGSVALLRAFLRWKVVLPEVQEAIETFAIRHQPKERNATP